MAYEIHMYAKISCRKLRPRTYWAYQTEKIVSDPRKWRPDDFG